VGEAVNEELAKLDAVLDEPVCEITINLVPCGHSAAFLMCCKGEGCEASMWLCESCRYEAIPSLPELVCTKCGLASSFHHVVARYEPISKVRGTGV
jgi:hypothetical protein